MVKNIKDDIAELEDWISQILSLIKELNSISKKKQLTTFFSISNTTSKSEGNQKPYLTPIRLLEGGVICGVVVFSQSQAMIAAKSVQHLVDKILVDSEKKIGMKLGVETNLLTHFKFDKSFIEREAKSSIEYGNISAAVREIIDQDKVIEYKPNDITVEAIWTFLSIKLSKLSGKRIAIFGCGNIGFKLALKLVESGVDIALHRRNSKKGIIMANSINLVKPKTTIASATYFSSPIEASFNADVLIGTANSGTPVISWEMIQAISSRGIVIDVGKGNIEKVAIQMASDKDIEVLRGDISASLYGFISHRQQMQYTIQNKIGRSEIQPGIKIVSGGIFGRSGEIVVDNYSSPGIIYGIADGYGRMKTTLNSEDKKNIKILKKSISKN